MRLSFKCACGAEFDGEDNGMGVAIVSHADKWQAFHRSCATDTREWKTLPDADIKKLWPFTSYQDSSLRFARDVEAALKGINT